MNKKTYLIIGGVVLVLALCACLAVALFAFFQYSQKPHNPVPAVATQALATQEAPAGEPTQAPDAPSSALKEQSKSVAGEFLGHLADRKYEDALAMTNPEMRANGASVEMFRSIVEEKGMDPVEWVWMKIQQKDPYVTIDGVIHFQDQRRGILNLELTSEGDQLLVSYLDIQVDGTSDPGQYAAWTRDREKEEDTFAIVAADAFFSHWAENDAESGWKFTSSDFRKSLGGEASNLQEYWQDFDFSPLDWTWGSEIQKTEIPADHPTIILNASVKVSDGGPDQGMDVYLVWEDGFWNVSGMDLVE